MNMRIAALGVSAAAIALVLGWVVPRHAVGAPGDLDPNFGGGGFVLGTPPASRDLQAKETVPTSPFDVALQSDDGVVALDGTQRIVRYSPDGTPDPSFGREGSWATEPLQTIKGLATDGQDRILVAIKDYAPPKTTAKLVRLKPDGSLDTSFANGGVFTAPTGDGLPGLIELATDSKGGIAAVFGSSKLFRLTPSGQLDTSFSGDGMVQLTSENDSLVDVAFRPDGRIVALSFGSSLYQLLPDGSIDPSFGPPGQGFASSCCVHRGDHDSTQLALGPEGSAYVQSGYCFPPRIPCRGGITRVSPDGTRDRSFGKDASVNDTLYPEGLVVDSAGRLLIGNASDQQVVLGVTRTSAAGALDRSFGLGGTATAFPQGCVGAVGDIEIDSQGRIVAGIGACGRWGVARFTVTKGPADADADGTLDKRDSCPVVAGKRHNGCPLERSTLVIRQINRHRALGSIASPERACPLDARVKLLRRRAGRDERVGTGRVHLNKRGRYRWRISAQLRPGSYYAKVGPHFAKTDEAHHGSAAYCRGVRSRRVLR